MQKMHLLELHWEGAEPPAWYNQWDSVPGKIPVSVWELVVQPSSSMAKVLRVRG